MGAFKVAIELDIKRRENDKKIGMLFLEMRDMMSALREYVVTRASRYISATETDSQRLGSSTLTTDRIILGRMERRSKNDSKSLWRGWRRI